MYNFFAKVERGGSFFSAPWAQPTRPARSTFRSELP